MIFTRLLDEKWRPMAKKETEFSIEPKSQDSINIIFIIRIVSLISKNEKWNWPCFLFLFFSASMPRNKKKRHYES